MWEYIANQVEYKTTWHTGTHLVSSAGRGAIEVDAGLSYGGLCSAVATLPWKKLYIYKKIAADLK